MRQVPEWLRAILMRQALPLAAAFAMVAFVGIPYVQHTLDQWFRSDIEMRARLVMNSTEDSLRRLLDSQDERQLAAYLERVVSDERLLAILICSEDGTRLFGTAKVPSEVSCSGHGQSERSQISEFILDREYGRPVSVIMVHDLSFIDRRQAAARNLMLVISILAIGILGFLMAWITRRLLNYWIDALLGDIRGRRFQDDAKSPLSSLPVLSSVRQALREAEQSQRLEIEFRENWTPQALKQVVQEHLGSSPLLVVSNREPYIHNAGADGSVSVQVPASGMVTALEPILRACSGVWIAHGSGTADRVVVDRNDCVQVPPDDPSYTLKRVWLSTEEEEGYYYGFSNEGIWPLCHLAYVRPAFRETDWQMYRSVNLKFAEAIARESRSDAPVVLIQDYHFALLPRLVRQRRPDATIAMFWHIPWPNPETFGICPWKREIITHMLGADILGFHTRYHCQNFLATVDRYVECQINQENMTITHQGRMCHVIPYPISIEWPPRWQSRQASIAVAREEVRRSFGIGSDVKLGLGVERWDFTKGIIERLQALEQLLDKYPQWRGRLSFLQVAAPTRSRLPTYQALQQRTLAEVERINRRFAAGGWQPIVLIKEHQDPAQVYKLFRAADFCLVNSLHDGMNLVAKEFVAARDDLDGVLILSTLAGASRELVEALQINPFDISETAEAINTALDMPREERRQRMKLMRRTVKENNVYRWAGRMLMDVARIRQRQSLTRPSNRDRPVVVSGRFGA